MLPSISEEERLKQLRLTQEKLTKAIARDEALLSNIEDEIFRLSAKFLHVPVRHHPV